MIRLLLVLVLALFAQDAMAQRFVKTFDTIDQMLAANPRDIHTNAITLGRTSASDGGGGRFYYDANSSTTTNRGTVFKPNSANGRWFRDHDGADVNVLWFGAVPNKTTDSTTAFKDALWFASKPTYGPIAGAASGYAALGVYVPPGEYKTTASLTNYGVNFHGKTTLHGGNYNADTVIHSMHSGPFMVSDYGGVTGPLLVADYRAGRVADIAVEGYPETYPGTKVSILSVTDRLNFTVAIGSLPTLDVVYPEMNFAFFYDDQGRWLGSGRIASINSGTGQVTLATDRDVYSTVGGSLLRTADKVVFSPVIAQESTITNFTDPASAGPCGFFLKCSYAGNGYAMEIDNVLVSNFHVGVRVGPGLLERRVKNIKMQACKFAGVCFPRESNTTDSPWIGFTYLNGVYRSDYGTSFSNGITNLSLCNTTAGFYGLGALDRMETVLLESCSYAQMAIMRGLSQHITFAYFDLCIRHGLVLFRGYTGNNTNSVYNNAVTFDSLSVRTPFPGNTKYELDPIHYERFAVDIPNSNSSIPALLNIGVFSVEDGAIGDFYSGIRTVSGVGNIVQIGQVSGRNGASTSLYTNQPPTFLYPAKNLSQAEVYNGVFDSAANKIGVASEGYLPAEFAKTGVTIRATNSVTPLTLVRSDTGKTVSFVIGTDTLLTRNESQSVYFNTANADTTFSQFTVGANGTATAPRPSILSGEVANSSAGTDVASNDFYIGANRGTGASTSGGRIIFQTPDATTSGTTPQTGTTKLKINREGQVNFTPRSTDPTILVGAGDLYYNSASNSFRWFNGTSWANLGSGGGGGVTDGDKGDITVSGSGSTWTIDPSTITYAKMQNVSAVSKLLGRNSATTGPPEEITLGSGLTMSGTTLSVSAGGGNVSLSGTPSAGQAAEWATSSTIQGVAVTGSGNYVKATSPSLTTPTLGVASGTSLAITGTAGGGFISFPTQSSAPSTPASGFVEYADSSGRVTWKRASDGFARTFHSTLTADRVYTFPDAATTIPISSQQLTLSGPTSARTITFPDANFTAARTDSAQTFSGLQTFAGNLETKNGTTGTQVEVFRTVSGGNSESLRIDGGVTTGTEFSIKTLTTGTGTARALSIYGGGGLWLQSDSGNVTLNAASSIALRTASATRWNIGANIVPNSALTGTIGASGTEVASVFSGTASIVSGGAANAAPVTVTGSWFSGGSATTTKPQVLVEPTGTTSTGWSTSGTGLGVNAASGFAGNLLDAQVAGVSKAKISSAGDITAGKVNGVTVTAGTGTPAVTVNGSATISGINTGDQQIGGASGWRFYEEFNWNSAGSGGAGWLSTQSGGANSMAAAPSANRPGIFQMSTSTSTTGNPNLMDNGSALFLGGGPLTMEWSARITTGLPSAADDYDVWMGLGDTQTASAQTDGVYFLFDRGVSATDWQFVTAKAGTRTVTPTGIAANGSGTWQKFRFEVNAAATSVIAYIDGVACATNTTFIPDTSANLCGKMFGLLKQGGTTGTTPEILQLDYVFVSQDFTTSR